MTTFKFQLHENKIKKLHGTLSDNAYTKTSSGSCSGGNSLITCFVNIFFFGKLKAGFENECRR